MKYEELSLADKCLVHRYRYYVLNDPTIADSIYDAMEKKAREECDYNHPINGVGSSLSSSYPEYIKEIALNNH